MALPSSPERSSSGMGIGWPRATRAPRTHAIPGSTAGGNGTGMRVWGKGGRGRPSLAGVPGGRAALDRLRRLRLRHRASILVLTAAVVIGALVTFILVL